jgi:hypothetical protein
MKTSINIVLDRSGSMGNLVTDTIGGVNHFIEEQQKLPGEAYLSLALFNTDYTLLHDAVPLKAVPRLTDVTYRPAGGTALFDAVGHTINATGAKLAAMPEGERPERVIFVIMTDGEENSSREFTGEQVKAMIAHQQDVYNWDFVFLGAGLDAMKGAEQMGVRAAQAHVYYASPQGTDAAFRGVSRGVGSYRGGQSVMSANVAPDPIKQGDKT